MENKDRDYRRLLDLESDGALETTDGPALRAALETSSELREERRQLVQLNELLSASRITPRSGFVDEVMARLPASPGWSTAPVPAARRWRFPVAALVMLAVVGAFLMSLDPGGLQAAASVGGLMASIGSLLTSTLMAGAGLLGASWRGVGMALGEALTLPQQVAFGAAVLALNILLFRLVRRGRRERATERTGAVNSD
ncbi:MAG: hypothetical protein K8J08_17765 [Thermoanaerobaculia bacterium]|nr:hypothetical protein [Thermoanaerobaculia bacterium]